jgi:hypothetical protein
MADETVSVTLAHPWEGHETGEKVMVDKAKAKALIAGGFGQVATRSDAAKIGADPETAASVHKGA